MSRAVVGRAAAAAPPRSAGIDHVVVAACSFLAAPSDSLLQQARGANVTNDRFGPGSVEKADNATRNKHFFNVQHLSLSPNQYCIDYLKCATMN